MKKQIEQVGMEAEESNSYRQSSGCGEKNTSPDLQLISKFKRDELESFIVRNSSLRAHGQQLFAEIYQEFSDRNDLFILTDADARLILLYSCPEILSACSQEVSLGVGALLSESNCGTNAITSALRYRESVVSSRPQHYGPLFKSCGTVAVPVLDTNHQPLACIAILNCEDESLGEKLLLAKFVAREFGKYYKNPPVPNIDVELPVPGNNSKCPDPVSE